MSTVLAPGALAWEALCCCALGVLAGTARALAPAKGRAGFAADFLLVGLLLILAQSYAAGVSAAGTLRWYMAAGAALGALWANMLLAAPLAAARRWAALPIKFLGQRARALAQKRRAGAKARALLRQNRKKTAKKPKKGLQNQRHLLYNSYV